MNNRLGFVGLAALVFGMMVGSGIFNIPQNVAQAAGVWPSIVAWIITAAGILTLVFTFKILSERKPELNAGLYLYAREGFGRNVGFFTAWGYWLCTAFANVAYAVMLNDAFGAFFPVLLEHGWATLAFTSALIWGVFAIVRCGMKTAVGINTAMSVIKVGSILLIIALLIASFSVETFTENLHAETDESFFGQVKGTMLITLWCFIGIEGAVMMSGRARRSKDVGRAGVAGFFAAWTLYLLVSVLAFGFLSRGALSGLENPSVAYVLKSTYGPWAYWMVIVAVILALGGGWIAWSIVTAEVPYTAARSGLFPRRFLHLNRHEIPTTGLLASSIIMQLFLFVTLLSEEAYLTALDITGMMILPCYMLAGMYLCKISRRHPWNLAVGILCTLFCAWTIYAGGMMLMLKTIGFYLCGLAIRRGKARA